MNRSDDDDLAPDDDLATFVRWTLPTSRRRPVSYPHPNTVRAGRASSEPRAAARRPFGGAILALGTSETVPPVAPAPKAPPAPVAEAPAVAVHVGRSRPRPAESAAPRSRRPVPPALLPALPVLPVELSHSPEEAVKAAPQPTRSRPWLMALEIVVLLLAALAGYAAWAHLAPPTTPTIWP